MDTENRGMNAKQLREVEKFVCEWKKVKGKSADAIRQLDDSVSQVMSMDAHSVLDTFKKAKLLTDLVTRQSDLVLELSRFAQDGLTRLARARIIPAAAPLRMKLVTCLAADEKELRKKVRVARKPTVALEEKINLLYEAESVNSRIGQTTFELLTAIIGAIRQSIAQNQPPTSQSKNRSDGMRVGRLENGNRSAD